MAKESLGYVELEWICPFCNTRNPGRAKVCRQCGAAQPKDVKFEQAAEDKIVSDQSVLESITAGPDVHCPFCGTRNPGNATKCSRCGGDLTDAEKRESGQIVGAYQAGPAVTIICDYCGSENSGTNVKCQNCGSPLDKAPRLQATATPVAAGKTNPVLLIAGVVIVLLICGATVLFILRGTQTNTHNGQVDDVNWKRTVVVMGLVPVNQQAWADQVPAAATVNSCREQQRGRSTSPTQNSEQVCGTPYLVDQGTGLAEMVQDCEYLIYDNYCEYSTIELRPVGMLEESGANLNPFWPETRLSSGEEIGEQQEIYEIHFNVDGRPYTYQTRDLNQFSRFTPGSNWELEINGFGDIVAVEPAD
jgi:ribosomal protein L40E